MPDHVLQLINGKVNQEKVIAQGQPSFKLGANEIPDDDEDIDDPYADPETDEPGPQHRILHEQPTQPLAQEVLESHQELVAPTPREIDAIEVDTPDDVQPPEVRVNDLPETTQPTELQELQATHRYNLRPTRSSWRDKYGLFVL